MGGDEQALQLADALRCGTPACLEHIHLWGNNIGVAGVIALLDCVPLMPSLKRILLGDNPITDKEDQDRIGTKIAELNLHHRRPTGSLLWVYKSDLIAGAIAEVSETTGMAGATVAIIGLQSKPELNGKHGKLISFNFQNERWNVEIEDGVGMKAFKASNLT